MTPSIPKLNPTPDQTLSLWRERLTQQRANRKKISRRLQAVRDEHGPRLTRRGLSELAYALGVAQTLTGARGELARTLGGELAELRREERLNGGKKSEPAEISFARRLVLLKISERFLCGPSNEKEIPTSSH